MYLHLFVFFFSPCGCVIFPYDIFLRTNVTNLEVRAASKICLAAVTAASDYMDSVVKGLQRWFLQWGWWASCDFIGRGDSICNKHVVLYHVHDCIYPSVILWIGLILPTTSHFGKWEKWRKEISFLLRFFKIIPCSLEMDFTLWEWWWYMVLMFEDLDDLTSKTHCSICHLCIYQCITMLADFW